MDRKREPAEPAEGIGVGKGPGPLFSASASEWRLRDHTFSLQRPAVMGILNLTPDSFSDGGELPDLEGAVRKAEAMVDAGARLLDVGGESTRPGAREVPEAEEIRRILPFVKEAVKRFSVPVSVDTRKSGVARRVLAEGAHVINDVSGLSHDPLLGEVVAEAEAGLILMHMRGTPADMRSHARYDDLMGEILCELEAALGRARAAGVSPERIALDPGIGFAKTAEHSVRVLRELGRVRTIGRPVVLGPSRKSFLGKVTGRPPRERVDGSVAACVLGFLQGARIFRVHDVREVVDALRVAEAVEGEGIGGAVDRAGGAPGLERLGGCAREKEAAKGPEGTREAAG